MQGYFYETNYISTSPKKIHLKHWQAPIIAGLCCGLAGTIFSEILGIGTDTLMLIITSEQNISYLIALLIGKLLLTVFVLDLVFLEALIPQLYF